MIPPPASHPSDSAPGDKPDNLAPSPGNLAPSLKRRRQPTPTTESSQGSSSASSSKEQSSGSSLGSGSLDSATHELIEMASRIAVKKGREAAPRIARRLDNPIPNLDRQRLIKERLARKKPTIDLSSSSGSSNATTPHSSQEEAVRDRLVQDRVATQDKPPVQARIVGQKRRLDEEEPLQISKKVAL